MPVEEGEVPDCELRCQQQQQQQQGAAEDYSDASVAAEDESLCLPAAAAGFFRNQLTPPVHRILEATGLVPDECLPSPEAVACSAVLAAAAFAFYLLRRVRNLSRRLREAEERIRQKKQEMMNGHTGGEKKKEIRIFMDGAFDMLHFGHMNAFRLARSLGTKLVVGVNSDESIAECKGAPLMNDSERLAMVEACKFVDEVVPDCPYVVRVFCSLLRWCCSSQQQLAAANRCGHFRRTVCDQTPPHEPTARLTHPISLPTCFVRSMLFECSSIPLAWIDEPRVRRLRHRQVRH